MKRNPSIRIFVPTTTESVALLDGLRYAGLVGSVYGTVEKIGVDIRCPAGQVFKEWQKQVIPHFVALGFNPCTVS